MATRRRPTSTRPTTRRRRSGASPRIEISPEVARSIVGLSLLVVGAVILIGLMLPGQGKLTDVLRDWIAPWFGAGRWLLPFLLLAAGWYVEWGPGSKPRSGWETMLVGLTVCYVSLLGLAQTVGVSGGNLGRFFSELFIGLITRPGAFVVLLAFSFLGLIVAFEVPLRTVVAPATRLFGSLRSAMAARAARSAERAAIAERERADARADGRPGGVRATGGGGLRGRAGLSSATSPGQTAVWSSGEPNQGNGNAIPVAIPSAAPTSATFAPARIAPVGGAAATMVAEPAAASRPGRGIDDVTDASDSPATIERRPWALPAVTLLDEADPKTAARTDESVHRRNEEIIVAKLASFNIPAQIVGRNAGPVVTQYEVQPAPDIKVSRIEGLADDLAMALAARSLRIEAPIPGKSAVGIEIPNKEFNVVSLRAILTELDFGATGSKLTFALGRDVAGKAQAVDLARMPHLLIAGATGSGKSVMVNALITSLLCEATPDDVRMVLIDLKRVELAGYNGLPHLMVPVITEPERAKAALKWAVGEMESRYRRFAGATARNIRAFNESRVKPEDRLPYIVIVIDELADLMMREGKNIEDPIVRLAQKARATGIHMVLATQRPSVNVVTGLIKANFPSRIAFAMASQIDSRTILDTPGAEDLIGRGDMLYQPADLPRPMRLQGVFVSDHEIARVTGCWRDQIGDPHYDMSIVESDDEGSGPADDLADEDADRLLPEAVAVIQEYDRASASLLQRRLKIGYARAARIIDQLESRGYIGAFDGSNARPVLRGRDTGSTGRGSGYDEDEPEP
ncbi:MAG TPA: DNA translocase FtsK [Candidatus Limnocylindrales bacterium]